MASNFDQTGVIQVNGAWATRVTYAVAALGTDTDTVDLRFLQGRAEVARAAVSRAELGSLLGEPNRLAIERHVANDADKYLAVVSGELRGPKLHYQQVTLPAREGSAEENSIARATLQERRATEPTPSKADPTQQGPTPETQTGPRATIDDAEEVNLRRANNARDPKSSGATAPVPAHIAAKYLVHGDAYHFDDQTVAFVDKGASLTVKTHNKAVIQDLMAIAQARDWQAITVSGTEAFRREAWKAGVAAGLSVNGYSPSDIERAALDRERSRREPKTASAPPADETRKPAASPTQGGPDSAGAPAREPRPAPDVVYGTLVDHGDAPYRHDPNQSPSYFVTIRDAKGRERTSWGVGLRDAVQASVTAPVEGDAIGIRRTGSTPVTVTARTVDEHGEIHEQSAQAKRQAWEVEKEAYFKAQLDASTSIRNAWSIKGEDTAVATPTTASPSRAAENGLTRAQEVAAAIRSAATTREELQLKYPDINQAVFQHLASHDQFADAYIKSGLIRESDRAQVIAQMRERLASKVEQGAAVRDPDNAQVNRLIRRSVNRVAADIGRPPVEISPRTPEAAAPRAAAVRDDVQVRA